jgi:hypothetical protein
MNLMNYSKSEKQNLSVALKTRPRDFIAHPKMLQALGADDYDKMEDLGQLQLKVEQTVTNF